MKISCRAKPLSLATFMISQCSQLCENLRSYSIKGLFILGTSLILSPTYAHQSDAYAYDSSLGISQPHWMKGLSDNTKLSEMSLIMTHDTMTYNLDDGGEQGVSTVTQRMSLLTQLNSGIRALDIRLKWDLIEQKIRCYHGLQDLGFSFNTVLDTVNTFLVSNPSETIYMAVKHEWGSTNDKTFALKMNDLIQTTYHDIFWDDNGQINPTLGETRSKVVMISLFNTYNDSYHIPSIKQISLRLRL